MSANQVIRHQLTYGSVCSGVEAASLAWEVLGLKPLWFAEIEKFPSEVLAYRWPNVPNLGDMTTLPARIRAREITAPDVLVGGTPCQAFSLAGLRGGLADPRGQLTLKFIEIANAIDEVRAADNLPPVIIVWENVPGVLISSDNAYGNFLAGLVGEYDPFEPGERPARGKHGRFWRWRAKAGLHVPKWTKHGHIVGRCRTVAWCVKDAKYFGVAQRRRRVFLVACAGAGIDPGSVLFEPGSMCRDTPPSRKPRETTTREDATGAGGKNYRNTICMATGQAGAEITQDDTSPTLTCNHEAPIVFNETGRGFWNTDNTAATIRAGNAAGLGGARDSTLTLCNPSSQIRRLLPIECERLQGMPDGHTHIPTGRFKRLTNDELEYLRRKRPELSSDEIQRLSKDAPRYKAIGNSMAVPVMRWLMTRILSELPVNAPLQSPSPVPKTVEKMTKKKRKTSKAVNTSSFVRPFLKWPGGKYAQLDQIMPFIGSGKRLIEPFVGAGSVFLNAQGFERYIGGDTSADLIGLYHALQKTPGALVDKARAMFDGYNSEKGYFDIREKFNRIHYTPLERAAALLYLNRHSYNGLMRYNLKGGFNSSYGKYKAPYFPADEMEAFSKLSPSCEFHCQSFVDTIRQAGEGDVLFCDPPYMPLPGKEGFTTYTGTTFTDEHQWQLLNEMVAAHQRGARVIATNSSNEKLVEAYRKAGFNVRDLFARRSMSCKGDSREIAIDIIATLGAA
ncbi:TPA: Dam family site-specific DNA-(adenine-N6)-methyltransferase [Citrobacter freundii]|uniref:Dam family site-specific DNA-(adenine-N6)-methyltransferase n=1 Tax=Citrobacter TaxID=544 RepID=UPI000D836483|nr:MULTISPECIES: Dam family site-specific DNA-(adenine-N6)-methyltransferase [Citrobacter]DAL59489.1 MAG TPA_asm: Cytosine specific methyltransferase [Caudoviricetes sp.]MDE9576068.1 Dam family site-specific DNA-(adenine-N6)-methyltransferase [Citrobacter portucalensis]MDM2913010.1 Dam family site-specific DNA-(adenine-N6)-methyltransferase [Citrobacter sp. Cpo035]MDM3220477.1 Dam family site-specific DNA-(adenine-N6)-methyltransferase [Citrobacter sp. Cf088]MDO3417960.1 Dam family site-specif